MKTHTALKATTALALVLGSATLATGALAQTAAPANPAARPEAATLSEIVVTAQRREENLQRAAIAITAVSGDEITRAGVTDTSQLTRVAPALQVGVTAGPTAQYYLRGVGNVTANALSDAAVSFNNDGVPIVRTNAIQGLFFDLERIEVLKGPQGTLYGRNATGGAVNVISIKPRLQEFSGYINGEVGNYDALKLTAAVNVPIGENTAVRIAGMTTDHDGYYSDGTGDDELRAIRAQITSEFSDSFRVTAGADYTTVGGKGSGATVVGLNRDDRIGLNDPRAGAVYSQALSPLAGSFLHPVTAAPFQDNEFWGLYAQADWDTGIGTLTVLPAYRKSELNFRISSSSFPINERLDSEQATLEVRLASDDSKRLSYLVGGFFLDEASEERPGYTQQYFSAHALFKTDTTSYAAFGRLNFKVTDNFRLTGGVRYTLDQKKALLDAYNLIVICPAAIMGAGLCLGTPELPVQFDVPAAFVFPNGDPIPVQPWGTSGAIVTNARVVNTPSADFKKTTYRVGFEYDAAPNSLVYGSYETGFKSGGFFNSIDNPVYQPETISAFTLGSKNRFFDNRLQLNIEAFWWDYEDQQISHFRLNSQGGSEFVTENVGKTEIRGIEVETRALVAKGTTLNATVQYLDAKYADFVYSNPAANGPPVTGCPVTFTGSAFNINCSGRQAINAPKWTATAGLEQVFDFQDGGRLTFNADGRYQTSSFTGFEQLPPMLQKAYFILDLQLQYRFPNEKLTVAAFGNNVTDKNVVGLSSPHPFGPSLIVEGLRPPRTYGVRVGYRF